MKQSSLGRLLKAITWIFSSDPAKRRRVRHESARMAAGLFGDFPISDDYKLWLSDHDFRKTFQRLSPHNAYSMDRKFVLREFVRFTASVPGDMAECGCYQGASAYFMAKEDPAIPLHLFDSFCGLSEPSARDVPQDSQHLTWQKGDLKAGKQDLLAAVGHLQNVRIYEGWIPERFDEVGHLTFKLVHIDVDLYQPTKESLAFFYPRLNPGGVIVLDDYGSTKCSGAYHACNEYIADKPEYIVHLPTGQGIIVKA